MSQLRAERASEKGQVSVELMAALFDKLVEKLIIEGQTQFRLHPQAGCEVAKDGIYRPRPDLEVNPKAINTFIRSIIARHQCRLIDEIAMADIKQVVGGALLYDVVMGEGRQAVVRTLKCKVTECSPVEFELAITILSPVMAGYGQVLNVDKAPDSKALSRWLDDFVNRLFALKNRPKDVIFAPNKNRPLVTVTGGIRSVEDVLMDGSTPITKRLSEVLFEGGLTPVQRKEMAENPGMACVDFDLAYATSKGHRCRVNIADALDLNYQSAPVITMRLLHDKPWTTKELPLPRVVLDTVLQTKMGLVLICGSTGSGKSTTLGVLIDYLLKRSSINLLAMENPIETIFDPMDYPRSNITQRELGRHTVSSHRGMMSAVRQTLNVAMVGEIREAEDALMALDLAKTGHLIFATLHANSVGESIARLIEMFPPDREQKIREMLATHYKMGLAQSLVQGLWGQTELVMEIMKLTPKLQGCIRGDKMDGPQLSMRELIEESSAVGNQSIDQALVSLYHDGKINEDILMYNSPDPTSLILRQSKLGLRLTKRWDPTGALIEEDLSGRMSLGFGQIDGGFSLKK